LLPKLFPILAFSRVTTWESRIENFSTDNRMKMITKLRKLKLLLHQERFMDLVLGKCSEELLPQSSSDFIYAIIVEEYGLIGGFGVLILYLLLVSICCSLAHNTLFGKLVVVGLGFR
jgi:cell division protein FtsW